MQEQFLNIDDENVREILAFIGHIGIGISFISKYVCTSDRPIHFCVFYMYRHRPMWAAVFTDPALFTDRLPQAAPCCWRRWKKFLGWLTVVWRLRCIDPHYLKISIIAPPRISVNLPHFWSTLLHKITVSLHFSSPVTSSPLWLTDNPSHSVRDVSTISWRPLPLRSCSNPENYQHVSTVRPRL